MKLCMCYFHIGQVPLLFIVVKNFQLCILFFVFLKLNHKLHNGDCPEILPTPNRMHEMQFHRIIFNLIIK